MALHDPARVLREIEAERRTWPARPRSGSGRPGVAVGRPPRLPVRRRPWPCDDMLDLASPYGDHPDFPRQALSRHSHTPQRMTGTHTPQVTPTAH
ncbi:DUF6221 family protein [Streptomyces sp. NPDC056653]|uniref:DUF6221 family protein n=1 Tax=Streptomyces sp. NPDC056653 TaxID=3345894 RepID=UPI0036846DA5